MLKFIENIVKRIIFKLFLSNVKFEETSEIKKIINKSVGLNWAVMDNVMVFKNNFSVPYTIKSIKTTMYNDAGQNVGYMDFEGDILVPKNSSVEHKIESRMSNITALFNMARFVFFDQVKVKAEGFSEIQIWKFVFKLPVSQIVQINSKMIQFQSDEQREEGRKRREKETEIRAYKKQKQIERQQREKEEALLEKKQKEAEAQLSKSAEKPKSDIVETTEIITETNTVSVVQNPEVKVEDKDNTNL